MLSSSSDLDIVLSHLSKDLNEACTYTLQILERKALCQQDPDQDEADVLEEEQAEYESVLIAAAADIVGSLASVIGPDFAQAFESFMPAMFKFYVSRNEDLSLRVSNNVLYECRRRTHPLVTAVPASARSEKSSVASETASRPTPWYVSSSPTS